MKKLLIFALIVAAQGAHAENCAAIKDANARLACFDKGSIKPKVEMKPKADQFAAAKSAMVKKLVDPESARFSDMFVIGTPVGDLICGMVNSKNSMGGYTGSTGFIYTPARGSAVMMFTADRDGDYTGRDAANYCQYCAPRGDHRMDDHCPSLMKAYGG